MKTEMGYYCPTCGKSYTVTNSHSCCSDSKNVEFEIVSNYRCSCGDWACEIDIDILSDIVKLNEAGFKTFACCAGHGYLEPAYIAFENILECAGIPSLWILEKGDEVFRYDTIRPILIENLQGNHTETSMPFSLYKHNYLESLHEWVNQIEKINYIK